MNPKLFSFAACALLMTSIGASAAPILGGQTAEGGDDSTCQIIIGADLQEMTPQERKLPKNAKLPDGFARCTGNLISPTQVLTAAHCLDHPELIPYGIRVDCGYQGPDPKTDHPNGAITIRGARFAESVRAKSAFVDPQFSRAETLDKFNSNDQGLLILEHALKSTPTPVMGTTAAEIRSIDLDRCRMSGYGTTTAANGDFEGGLLQTAPLVKGQLKLSPTQPRIFQDFQILKLATKEAFFGINKILRSNDVDGTMLLLSILGEKAGAYPSGQSGDSGGPLLCKLLDQPSASRQIGIFSMSITDTIPKDLAITLEEGWVAPVLELITKKVL